MLFRPIKPFKISQHFGDNKVCVDLKTGKDYIPCDGLNPPKGYKSIYSQMKGHNGLDIPAERGQVIYSAMDGYVEEEQTDEVRGLGLGIISDNKYPCTETGKDEHFKVRYWHNLMHLVHKGDKVSIGQPIALADSTGYSTGHHLHFEVKPVSVKWKKDKPTIKNLLQDNGYFGAIDPEPYLLPYDASILQGVKGSYARLVALLKIFAKI